MYNDAQQYTLSFVPPQRRPKTRPRLVVSTYRDYLPELQSRLSVLTENWQPHADSYCGGADKQFCFPIQSLFDGPVPFGYGRCGCMSIDGKVMYFEFELRNGDASQCIALSLKLLLQALNVAMPGPRQTNQPQQIEVEMRCEWDAVGYGHAMGGSISPLLLEWLKRHAAQGDGNTYVPLPAPVVSAMRATWMAVAYDDMGRWASDCSGYTTRDGRFSLVCFGNACDIAIYPDGSCGSARDGNYHRFSCHNLDRSDQQLTLLAGLAKLCEIARTEEPKAGA
jgi:hypothetical protein